MKKDTFAIVRFEEASRMCHTLLSNVSSVETWSFDDHPFWDSLKKHQSYV